MNLDDMKTFGVEVEFLSNFSRTEVSRQINAATGIPIYLASYSDKDSSKWRLKTDSSIRSSMNGMELVTPVLKGEDDMAKLRDVMAVLGSIGEVNVSCGLHVHIGVDKLDQNQYKKLLKLWLKYEIACDYLQPMSRRNNTYCQPNNMGQGDSRYGEYGERLLGNFKMLNRCKNSRQLVNNNLFGHKYRKLNTGHYWGQGTVEFRSHSGTVNSNKVDHWVRLTQAFVAAAENSRGTVINIEADESTYRTKVMLNDFYKKGFIQKETYVFYKKRYKELNNAICR
jgi:hypothetical protein